MTCNTDKIQTVVDFIGDIKPFHSKIYEVHLTYEMSESVQASVSDQHSWDVDIVFDYDDEMPIADYGWDVSVWDDVWKAGHVHRQPIVEINPVGGFISLVDDVTYSFASDAYYKGVTPVIVTKFDPVTGRYTLARPVPWETGYPVSVECTMLYPAPINAASTYYVIVESPISVRLAETKAKAQAGLGIQYDNYSAGTLTLRALQHSVVNQPSGQLIYVTGTIYDTNTNRTKVFLSPESFSGLTYGFVDVYTESNWDNPQTHQLDRASSYTTVLTTITESISFDFTDIKLVDLVAGPTLPDHDGWGGDTGERILSPISIDRVTNKITFVGDWRFFTSSELSSSTTGSFKLPSFNQPNLNIRVIQSEYIEGYLGGVTSFTVEVIPNTVTLSSQFVLYTNSQTTKPVAIVNAYWDRVWDGRYATDDNTADAMITETIQVFSDDESVPVIVPSWDSDRWDVTGFDREVF